MDRAKAFYVDQVGFDADHDHPVSEDLRFVQLTPPGLGLLDRVGYRHHRREPGSVQGLQMVVADIDAAHAAARRSAASRSARSSSSPWGSFVFFDDPDGNGWAIQQAG